MLKPRSTARKTAIFVTTLALGLAGTFFAAAPASAAADPVADLKINVSGPANGTAGSAFSYTIDVTNNGPGGADGATFSNTFPQDATGVTVSCTSSGGGSCPTDTAISSTTVTGSISSLPVTALITVTVSGTFAVPSGSSVTSSAHIDPPAATTDPMPASNDSSVSTGIDNSTDIQVTKTQSSSTITTGVPITYGFTVTNTGPAAADNTGFSDSVLAASMATAHVVSCTGTLGVVCPSSISDAGYSFGFSGSIASFPAGASLSVVYELTFGQPECSVNDQATITNGISAFAPSGITDTNFGNNQASVTATQAREICPQADIAVSITQDSATATPGVPINYSFTITNNGPADADGATFSNSVLSAGDTVSGVSCTAAGGAVCPSLSYSHGFSGSLDTFPSSASITVTYAVTYDQIECGYDPQISFTNSIQAQPPSGTNDFTNNNSAQLNQTMAREVCPLTDIQVTKTQSSTSIVPGTPMTYSVTVANNGPTNADGTNFNDSILAPSPTTGQILSCTVTGGAQCPSLSYSNGFGGLIPTLPSGGSLTVSYEVVFTAPSTCNTVPNFTVSNVANAQPPSGVNESDPNNNSDQIDAAMACHDIVVNSSTSTPVVSAGDVLTITDVVTNSTNGDANSVLFSNPLPAGFVYVSASCGAGPGSSCGTLSYDAATNTVSSTIPTIAGAGGSVTITIQGTAPLVPGTYNNVATAVSSPSGTDAFFDPVPSSNTSIVSTEVVNTTSTVVITKILTGLPASGLPSPLTFTGAVNCDAQGTQSWSITVPAGATSAVGPTLTFYDGDSCEVVEDAAPAAPTGYSYDGVARLAPSVLDPIGPDGSISVISTTALIAPEVPIDPSDPPVTPTKPQADSPGLAVTGSDATPAIGAGLLLSLIGGGFVAAAAVRRRRRTAS